MQRAARALVLVGCVPLALLAFFATFAVSALSACDRPPKPVSGSAEAGGSSSTPATGPPSAAVIDQLDLSTNAQVVGGSYNIYGSITFHDDVEPVHLIRVRVPVINRAYDFTAGDQQQVFGASLDIVVSADLPLGGAGPTTFNITLVDQDGHESAPPLQKTVDLQ